MKLDEQGIHIHQSDINGHCLEQLRLDTVAVGPRQETDAATVGTALHAGIEDELNNGFCETEEDVVRIVIQHFVDLLASYADSGAGYVQSSFGSPDAALKMLDSCARSWFRSDERTMLAQLTRGVDYHTEWEFDLPFCTVDWQPTPRSKPRKVQVWRLLVNRSPSSLEQHGRASPEGDAAASGGRARPRGTLRRIAASIVVEREAHKGMVIGEGGERLKRIGSEARQELEHLWQAKVFLELWIKVRSGWADDEAHLRSYGYE